MATIQVRDISDRAYATLRERARTAGQSLQAYMRAQIEQLAAEPTDDELFEEIEEHVERYGVPFDREQILEDLDAGRR